VDAVNALIRRNVQIGVKSRPLSLVTLVVFSAALITLLYLAQNEGNRNVRTMLYMIAAFSFVAVLGQLSVIRTWFKRKSGP
jgi:xanthine/uracil permease